MGAQIAQLLIETAFGLLIYVVLLRFWMQALRAPFRNPVGQFVIALTDWAVLPLRRVVPSFRGYDLSSFAVAWLAQILKMVLLYAAVAGGKFAVPGPAVLGLSLVELLRASLHLLIFVVIVQVIMSWVSRSGETMPSAANHWSERAQSSPPSPSPLGPPPRSSMSSARRRCTAAT